MTDEEHVNFVLKEMLTKEDNSGNSKEEKEISKKPVQRFGRM